MFQGIQRYFRDQEFQKSIGVLQQCYDSRNVENPFTSGTTGFKVVMQLLFNNRQGGPGSVRFGYGLGMERFERFRFSVPAVPLQKGFSVFQYILKFRFRFLENGSGGSGSAFGSCKNGSDGSGFRFRFGSWATLNSYSLESYLAEQVPRPLACCCMLACGTKSQPCQGSDGCQIASLVRCISVAASGMLSLACVQQVRSSISNSGQTVFFAKKKSHARPHGP